MIESAILLSAYHYMCLAKNMAETYEANRQQCKYVHSTSRGHEAIQLATAFNLQPQDFVSPYYRDESMLLGLGFTPYQLMLQLLAKGDDIFTGGREYYSHPNFRGADKPTIIHQSSATGMQAIPTTGIAQGMKYKASLPKSLQRRDFLPLHVYNHFNKIDKEQKTFFTSQHSPPQSSPFPPPSGEIVGATSGEIEGAIVLCSLGDASITEGEVSEALQFAALHQLPIIFLVQDNGWGISVAKEEARLTNANEFVKGFGGIKSISIDGSDFCESYEAIKNVVAEVRKESCPYLIHAKVPLLGHHTSGVRKEFYRSEADLTKHFLDDPTPKLRSKLLEMGILENDILQIEINAAKIVDEDFAKALAAPEPDIETVEDFVFVPTLITEENGIRSPEGKEKIMMVDAALFAIREIMEQYPEAVLYGQDVGKRLGGVFREAATLAEQFGDNRVFNTAIQEAYIIGSTVGMCAVGLKPIVEVQFADYIFPGLNQLVTEISKSCYLTCGKFPIQTLIRIPIGAYGGGGPYHSGSIESLLLTIKGIKIVYPSNAADMKGLMKAAFLDPNPVIMLEHKGLYWSKVPGTDAAKTIEPSADYVIPLGKANVVLQADKQKISEGETCCIITYGMGVHWAVAAAINFKDRVEVVDLRTLFPLDETLIFAAVKKHGKCLIVTEEPQNNSFAEALAGRISKQCFKYLDAAVEVIGALNIPAVPMNVHLEKAMLPNADKVLQVLGQLLNS
jgi:2-oxoisovalerate dehydrogenase E1 component